MLRVFELYTAEYANILYREFENISYDNDVSVSLYYGLMGREIVEHYVNHTAVELNRHIKHLFEIIDPNTSIYMFVLDGLVIEFDKVEK